MNRGNEPPDPTGRRVESTARVEDACIWLTALLILRHDAALSGWRRPNMANVDTG